MSIKFEIEELDGKITFSIWRVQVKTIITDKKALERKSKMPLTMTKEKLKEPDEMTFSLIQLFLT